MKGAIIGDIIGSIYEFHNLKSKNFPLFSERGSFTDDTVMTVAVAMGMLWAYETDSDLLDTLTDFLYDYGNRYPHRGYGGRFRQWLRSSDPQPYNSWGNGAPMRCSAAGWLAKTPEKAFTLGMYTAAPTHNHPDAMMAAGVTAMLIWQARHGMQKDALQELAEKYYEISRLNDIRDTYEFDVSCMGTMPVAFASFFESTCFEDTIRNAISVGGDSDTIAAIAGSLAEAYYGIPEQIWDTACTYLDDKLVQDVDRFYRFALSVN